MLMEKNFSDELIALARGPNIKIKVIADAFKRR